MRQQLQILSVTVCMLLFTGMAKAQFGVGGGLAFNHYKGEGFKGSFPAFQLRLSYDGRSTPFFINAGFNLSPKKVIKNQAVDILTPVGVQENNLQQQATINNAFLHGGYAFAPGDNDDFRVRLFAGASMDFISVKFRWQEPLPASYPKNLYMDTSMTNTKADVGAGVDFRIGSGRLFADLTFAFPLSADDKVPIFVGHRGFSLGYSYTFGGRRNYW